MELDCGQELLRRYVRQSFTRTRQVVRLPMRIDCVLYGVAWSASCLMCRSLATDRAAPTSSDLKHNMKTKDNP
ncbi:hypothetical protein VAPA_1c46530 [Variovorax paradoxus B4]|uniref:Uncharacterized protein n=1 Tax=Variovorax paradoxus B4 TaxID=1246301 RepID=T1XGT2_VARPD|nr:hypothetical protein VAPA_1c46530 [Variovorax paradoxus B4]